VLIQYFQHDLSRDNIFPLSCTHKGITFSPPPRLLPLPHRSHGGVSVPAKGGRARGHRIRRRPLRPPHPFSALSLPMRFGAVDLPLSRPCGRLLLLLPRLASVPDRPPPA
jgi:hypothetical protein